MSTLQAKLRHFADMIAKERANFDISQRVQFDWLGTISTQLDLFADDTEPDREPAPPTAVIAQPDNDILPLSNLTTIGEERVASGFHRCATAPLFTPASPSSGLKFVCDDSLLGSSEEDDAPIPFTVSGSLCELTRSAASFREKWQEMLQMKKACTNAPAKFTFAFEEMSALAAGYEMSDGDASDDEIYDQNPVEIHGKVIPLWARGDRLLRQLRRQTAIDPVSIFAGFTAACPLPEIFGAQKARWENRNDSGWCDSDEGVSQVRVAAGLE